MKQIITILLLALLVGNPIFAQSETFEVTNLNDSGPGSLREAINNANANGNEATDIDFINVLVEGTITITSATAPGIQLLPAIFATEVTANNLTIEPAPGLLGRFMGIGFGNLQPSTLRGITFRGASSSRTGGALSLQGTVTIENCAFFDNQAGNGTLSPPNDTPPGEGFGGAAKIGQSGSVANVTFTNCTFGDNNAKDGAALKIDVNTVVTLDNCTFNNNVVTNGISSATASTVFNEGTLNMTNTIIAGTLPAGTPDLYDTGNTININVNNLIQTCEGPGCTMGGASNGFASTADPMLGALGDNGGATLTYPLTPQSPALLRDNNVGAQPIPIDVEEVIQDRLVVVDLPLFGNTYKFLLLLLVTSCSLTLMLWKKNAVL